MHSKLHRAYFSVFSSSQTHLNVKHLFPSWRFSRVQFSNKHIFLWTFLVAILGKLKFTPKAVERVSLCEILAFTWDLSLQALNLPITLRAKPSSRIYKFTFNLFSFVCMIFLFAWFYLLNEGLFHFKLKGSFLNVSPIYLCPHKVLLIYTPLYSWRISGTILSSIPLS